MDVLLLDCVFPEASRPVYKRRPRVGLFPTVACAVENPSFCKPLAYPPCSPALEIWPVSSRPRAAADDT
jgi:hypothetical protein